MRVVRLDEETPASATRATGTAIGADGVASPVEWDLADEAAISFLVNGEAFAVMLATPADLTDFALGFLYTERIITAADELIEVRLLETTEGQVLNCIVDARSAARAGQRRRTLTGRSGCGLCGAETLAMALPALPRVSGEHPAPAAIMAALTALPAAQPLNTRNHSTHAAAFCRLDGSIELVREDVGRHNALDKLGGAMLAAGIDPRGGFGLLSSRLSVEMVQKAVLLGLPFLASVSAPTGLALEVAHKANLGIAARSRDGVVLFQEPAG